jgi:hypothetical protein
VVKAESQDLNCHQAAPEKEHLEGVAVVCLVLRLLRWVGGVAPVGRLLQSEGDFLGEAFDRLITEKAFFRPVVLVFCLRLEDGAFCHLKVEGASDHLMRSGAASHRAEEAASFLFRSQEGA